MIAGISLAVTTATSIGIGVHERAPDPRGQEIVLQHSAPDSPSPQPPGDVPIAGGDDPSTTVSPIPVEPGEPSATAAAGTHDATSVVERTTNRRRKPVVKHHEKVANAERVDARPVVTKPPVPTPVEAPPPVEVSAQALAAQYAAVGSTLKQLGDEATDLWPSYRRIILNEAMQTPERRAEAAKLLSELQKLAAARK